MNELASTSGESCGQSWRNVVLIYVILLLLAIFSFAAIRAVGERGRLASSTGELTTNLAGGTIAAEKTAELPSKVSSEWLPRLLIAWLVVIAVGRVVGTAATWVGQPRVVGEIAAGIVLGPSVLGRIAPSAMEALFPGGIMPMLSMLAQLGVILFMFLIGLELNAELLRKRARETVLISHASIVVPFILGAALALWLFGREAPAGVPFTSFALFMGVAMSITAFPVLARILADRKIDQTELGVIALSCAAADDVTAWCLLAFVVGVAQAELTGAVTTAVLSIAYLAVMLGGVRPWISRRWRREGSERQSSADLQLSTGQTTWILVALLISAVITESIGIHAIFGAFLWGAVIPHQSAVARAFRVKLDDVVAILLLPMFFALNGLRTELGLLSHATDWLACGLIILIATLGKFGGTLLAARISRLPWRTAAALGVLMNTRGLMELIVLNIGLDLGIVSPRLFAMMVLMAIITTVATTPLLARLTCNSTETEDNGERSPGGPALES